MAVTQTPPPTEALSTGSDQARSKAVEEVVDYEELTRKPLPLSTEDGIEWAGDCKGGLAPTDIPLGSLLGVERDMPTLLGTMKFMHMAVYMGTGAQIKEKGYLRDIGRPEADYEGGALEATAPYVLHLWHPDHKEGAEIRVDPLSRVGEGCPIYMVELKAHERRVGDQPIRDGLKTIGTKGFHMVTNSCQHYATNCVYGEEINVQMGPAFRAIAAPSLVLGGVVAGAVALPFSAAIAAPALLCGVGAGGVAAAVSPLHTLLYVKEVERTQVDFATSFRPRDTLCDQLC